MGIHRILSAAVLVALCACGQSPTNEKIPSAPITTPAKAADSPALRLVREQKMGKNLGPLAWGIAKGSSTSLALVAEKYGTDKATRVMAAEIQELVPTYIERWEEALADAYARQLSTEELNSVADLGVKSPHYQKLLSVQAAVGQEMRQTGRPIVEDLVSAAFENAITDAP